MRQLRRFFRAFIGAIKLTLRGEAILPPDLKYPNLYQWMKQGQQLVQKTIATATANGMDQSARQSLILNLDRRDISMETILQAVSHNMQREYPMLLESRIEHNLTALYAMNMNDRYRIEQLAAADLPQNVASSVQMLAQHLADIPPSTQA